jgi:hypothetical protein
MIKHANSRDVNERVNSCSTVSPSVLVDKYIITILVFAAARGWSVGADLAAASVTRREAFFVWDCLGPKNVAIGEGLMIGGGPCALCFLFFGVRAHENIITILVFAG